MDISAPVKPPQGRRRRRRGGFFLRFLGFMFAAAMIVFIAVAGAAAFVLWKVSSELPDYEELEFVAAAKAHPRTAPPPLAGAVAAE